MIAPPVSRRAQAIRPSATLAVAARAGELKAEGKDVLDFSAGEPDFKPPRAVCEAVARFAVERPIHYAPVPGTPKLRDAIADELERVHGHRWSRGEILVSNGAKHSLANLFLAACDPGDEVVIPAPYWVSYPDMVGLAEAKPVIVESRAEDGFVVRPEALEAVLTERTKFFILNSPSNPTGAGYREADIRSLGEVLAAKAPQAWIVCDDIYRQLVYDGFQFASALRTLQGLTDRIVVVDGVSKTYAMTGYRIGYMAGPAPIISAASRIQSQTTSGAATLSLWAAEVALTDPTVPADVKAMHEAFTRRRRLILDRLAEVPGVAVRPPDGAFYVFVDVSAHCGPGTGMDDDIALAKWLLETGLVGTVPGTPFGAPGYLRMSYATDDATIRDGVSRIATAFASLPTGRGA